jgi:integral membrane protein (TIGR01906 family)
VPTDIPQRAGSVLIALATAIVLPGLAVLPFLNPAWVGYEQDRSGAASLTGLAPADLRTATNAILWDLVFGPPDFDVEVAGAPVLTERERSHMRDVRGAFLGAATVAALAAGLLLVQRRRRGPTGFWRHVRRGAVGLGAGIVVLGGIATVAFDAAFEVFHRLFFAGGTYTFDPATDRLVQLFPMQFWFETSIAVGVVAVFLAMATFLVAGRRAERAAPEAAGAPRVAIGSPR